MKARPITIAIPVYNGEAYLRQSIESVLSQDFGDFDLTLHDNASTDSTWEICNLYASRDKRVTCFRNDKNLGSIKNFLLARQRSCSAFFKWHAHDDIIEPTFIGKAYQFMAANSDYLACTSRIVFMDETGTPYLSEYLDFSLDSANPVERFRKFYGQGRNDYAFPYGLMRKAMIDGIGFRKLWGADWVFVTELIMRGKIHQIQQPLLFFRIKINDPESYAVSNGPVALWAARSSFFPFPNLRLNGAIASVIKNSSLPDEEKRRILSMFRAIRPLDQAVWRDCFHMLDHWGNRFPLLGRVLRMLKRHAKDRYMMLRNHPVSLAIRKAHEGRGLGDSPSSSKSAALNGESGRT